MSAATLQPDFVHTCNMDYSSLSLSVLRGFAFLRDHLQSRVGRLALTIPPKSASKKRLPKHSMGAPVRPARRTRLQCSEHIVAEPTHRCGYKRIQWLAK